MSHVMQFDARDCFHDEHDDVVDTVVIVETGDFGYRISDHTDEWQNPYWIPADTFESWANHDRIEKRGALSGEQYERLCEQVDVG